MFYFIVHCYSGIVGNDLENKNMNSDGEDLNPELNHMQATQTLTLTIHVNSNIT